MPYPLRTVHSLAPPFPAAPQVSLSAVMRRVDSSNDGQIDLTELVEWWSESRELLQHLDEALNSDNPAMLTEAIKRGLRQVPPLQHGTMEEAKTALVETHKRELPPLLTPAVRERLWECKVRGCARWVLPAEIGLRRIG